MHNLRGKYLGTQIGWVCDHQSRRIWRWELPGLGGSEAGSRRGPCMAVLGIKGGSCEALVGRRMRMKSEDGYRLSCREWISWLLPMVTGNVVKAKHTSPEDNDSIRSER